MSGLRCGVAAFFGNALACTTSAAATATRAAVATPTVNARVGSTPSAWVDSAASFWRNHACAERISSSAASSPPARSVSRSRIEDRSPPAARCVAA